MDARNGVKCDIPELPAFLTRDANNQSEITRMRYVPKPVLAPETEAAEAPEAPKAKGRTKAAKGNGTAKAPVKAAAKAPAKAKGKAPAKQAKPAKAKVTRKAREYDPAKLDQYGLRLTSGKSKAAAMYARKEGATLAEVKAALKSTQFNVLTELRGKGWVINEKQEDGNGPRKVTRYFLKGKAKG